MQITLRWAALATTAALLQMAGLAQQASQTPSGHWEGTQKMGPQDIAIAVDLTKNSKGEWIGTAGMPELGLSDLPVTKLSVVQNAVHFILPFPGAPAFEAKLSGDGKTLAGNITSGTSKIPVSFKRLGEAKIKLPPPSSALTKEFEGAWKGTLQLDGGQVRILVKLSRGGDGLATGTIGNQDQANREVPLSTVSIKGKVFDFESRVSAVSFHGTMNAAGTAIVGEWSQLGKKTPLTFSRNGDIASPSGNSPVSKNLEGTWQGVLDVGGAVNPVTLVLRLTHNADGTGSGTISTSDKDSKITPISNIVQKDKTVSFEVHLLSASYHGTLNVAGNAIAGEWVSFDKSPLTFKRVASATKP